MTTWLRAADCPLLKFDAEDVAPLSLRLVQRLLEISLMKQSSDELAAAMLEEVGSVLRADFAAVAEATPEWQMRWHYSRRGVAARTTKGLPRQLLGEVLDREAGVIQPASADQPATLASCLSYTVRPNRVLYVVRQREAFDKTELEYGVSAGHYLGVSLEAGRVWDDQRRHQQRLESLISIGKQLVEERETVPLLEHIAEQAAQLLGCERSTIFIWDQGRKELVGRPALGLPNGELRIPDSKGIVGRVVQTGEDAVVDDVAKDPDWFSKVDNGEFQTRNLVCVALKDREGKRLGALEAMNKAGSFTDQDVQTLHALADHATAALQNVREREALVRSNNELEGQARLAAQIVGASAKIEGLRGQIERLARTELPVLVLGESGTGKDVVARAIHYSSGRQQHPYVPVNCAAIAETLIESELFGHEKGAFTDAHNTRAGKFEAASGGTLFLDEVGDLSAGGQAKLLRVLEEKVVYRVGGTQPIPVDTRIVAATNRNLAEAVRKGKFREDLFYRLSVVTIDLPPLRDRRDDVLVLAEHFLHTFCKQAGRKTLKFTAEARKRLEQHNWPGNVRELRNLLERIAYLCPNEKVEASDLAFILSPGSASDGEQYATLTLSDATDVFQREHIKQAIKRAGNNMSEAAKLLGLHRPNLYRKMRMLQMDTTNLT